MAHDPLTALPPAFAATRTALHAVAEHVVSPACVAATGNEIALEATAGGFGTPQLPDGGRVRVAGIELVVDEPGGGERRVPLETLAGAADVAGLPPAGLADGPLDLDRAAAAALAGLFAFAWDVLTALRDEAPPGAEPSPVRLWPEHFDFAFEQGSEAVGRRAGYGVSPGDEHHPEPYVYVVPWVAPDPGPLWDAAGFAGAELSYGTLRAAPDARASALEFLRGRRDALLAGAPGS